ncbi:MAG: hypothetical protein ACKPKO_14100, partial [Candidatus Fonsibacter sp.]
MKKAASTQAAAEDGTRHAATTRRATTNDQRNTPRNEQLQVPRSSSVHLRRAENHVYFNLMPESQLEISKAKMLREQYAS